MESGTRQHTQLSPHCTLRESFLASDLAEENQISLNGNRNTTAHSHAGLTLASVLNNESKSPSTRDRNSHNNSSLGRTLLDIIRNEETLSHRNSHFAGNKTWKSFKDRLRIKRIATGSRCASFVPVPQSDLDVHNSRSQILNYQTSIQNSPQRNSIGRVENGDSLSGRSGGGSMRLSTALTAEREETRGTLSRALARDENTEEEILAALGDGADLGQTQVSVGAEQEPAARPAQQSVRISLMHLLEEADQQAGIQQAMYRLDEDEEEEGVDGDDKEEEQGGVERGGDEGGGGGGKGEYSCCVCMVRHKGAAFIPCGHTFCRLCSRELWLQRGNCPLCNGFILEILDIF
ncbi:hypothetical protein Nepgr_029764 [Nepenthes gracilis]|uniref:RING-type domain-containing protein n=1 Tax=Nepenthes gracilis TaxID=150966 RepID=A0AAD3TFM9_NEPGR|nr:hypothetical protein Nepgr_029764 [Nepenthes gracilis]